MRRYTSLAFTIATVISSCGSSYPYKGKVVNIDPGKDGYTATFVQTNGDTLHALFSKVNMETNYVTLKAGDEIEVDGDTLHLENHIHIVAAKVKLK